MKPHTHTTHWNIRHKKKRDNAICSNMEGPRDNTKCKKTKDKCHKRGLCDTNELIRKKARTKTQQQTYTYQYI